MTIEQLNALMLTEEDEHLEFKEAKGTYNFVDLRDYCAALSNEGGGRLVLGVSNRRPRKVVGTRAYQNLQATKADLLRDLGIRVEAAELRQDDRRVLVFDVPRHPLGMVVYSGPKLLMRGGEGLVRMTQDVQRRILNEVVQDFSALKCPDATLDSLDAAAIESLRARWQKKSGRTDLADMTARQLLEDAELLSDGGVTFAAVVLLGTGPAVSRFLPQAEVIFEYRSSDAAGPAQDRHEFRQGFFLYDDDLWKLVNLRNDKQHYQDGLFIWDVPTFSERVVREAVLNAVSHRDYRLGGSVFVRQYQRRLEIVSPGGFPEDISPENILWKQHPRNRRIADVLGKCGMVDRSGQGADVMFAQSIRESKAIPDYSRSDDAQVFLTLDGVVQDVQFLRFLEQATKETGLTLTTEDLLVLNRLRTSQSVEQRYVHRIQAMRDAGLVETVSHGRGTRYMLARKWYVATGDRAGYTRRRGLDRETNKELLLKHLQDAGPEGERLSELCRVLPSLSYDQVRSLLRELHLEGKIYPTGRTRSGRWHLRQFRPNVDQLGSAWQRGHDT